MSRSPTRLTMPALYWRVVAVVAAGMVILLTVSSASPALHDWLHAATKTQEKHVCGNHAAHAAESGAHAPDAEDEDESHECAVTMFSHGVVYHAGALLAQPCEGILRAANLRAFERLALAQPRFLHLPPQAPPAV